MTKRFQAAASTWRDVVGVSDEQVAAQIRSDRIDIGASPHADALRAYNRIDLALDPFPFNGGVTTCDALCMGIPVITCPGQTFASRHSMSHLSNLGMIETVTEDLDQYVEMAVELAGDLPRIAKWRAELRERMSQSSLCDGPRFAGDLGQLLRSVWQQWCQDDAG